MNSDQVLYLDIYFTQIVEVHVVNIFLSDSLLALELFTVPPMLIDIKVHAVLSCQIPSNY